MPSPKQCFQCGNDNPADHAFCGNCGSPLTLNDYISRKVKDQLSDSIQNRDVLEMDSSIKVFKQAWDWIKLIIGVAVGLLVLTGAGVIWKASDFWSGVEVAKQSVVNTSKNSSDEIARSTSRFQQEISKQLDVGKAAIKTASSEAARQSQAFKTTTLQTQAENARQATSLRHDIESSRKELQAASKFEPEMDNLRKQLAQANSDIQAQQKALSSSEAFVKSVFGSHVIQYFSFKLNAGTARTIDLKNRYAVIPPTTPQAKNTVVLMLVDATPIEGTLQLQQRVAVQPPNSFFNVHNLVIFFWGDAPSGLEQQPLSVSYFPDKSDTDIIHSLSEHDGRVFADDQPLPKFGETDPDFKGNKWMNAQGG
jgi:hypothetical protein